MRISICPDSFKGSLTAQQASSVMSEAIKTKIPDAECIQLPMADGGEGTVESLIYATDGKRLHFEVTGPLGSSVSTIIGESGTTGEALIEVANVSGLTQVPVSERNPLHTTSFGLGELILNALNLGYRKFIIGLGGSATNDGGIGMLSALGAEFYDASNNRLSSFGHDLLNIHGVDFTNLDPRLNECTIRVASDVENPLVGRNGASQIFGPQKGADESTIEQMDQAMDAYSDKVEESLNLTLKNVPGAGAAGGLGFALMIIGAKLESGAKLIANVMELEEAIKQSDIVLTGEGRSDSQTIYGKAPGYVAKIANQYNKPSVLISGSIDDDDSELQNYFSGLFSTIQKPVVESYCINNAERLLFNQTANVMHFYQSIMEARGL